ncbi:MAG: 16S rRNA (uracil(1498)-N(3))-methyltransferase [Nitrosomonadaceae bacterium]|nr:16S rRNA (uracil(1498)-N(3))-methyltransferase [Nitrosomonadaceae bacterium]|tara:strand:+ start:3193 stop:3960 length:768 start_codon:yes stop_codon:yes gene_type:complete
MAFSRFYYPHQINVGQLIELPVRSARHAVNVLRLGKGEKIILFNGQGGEFLSFIKEINKVSIFVLIEAFMDVERESPLQITLVQSICINIKMDLIIRKAVELGVNSIQPIVTKRCLVKLSEKRELKRLFRWQQIVISACEQCGRNFVPQVLPPVTISDWLLSQGTMRKELSNEVTGKLYFILSPIARMRLSDFSKKLSVTELTVLVGPEGGFTSEEYNAVISTGFSSLRLGDRILRTESVALAALSSLQAVWGDY